MNMKISIGCNPRQWAVFLILLLPATGVSSQETVPGDSTGSAGLKTNLLYDATGTFNLGAEFRTGRRASLDMSASWNPWTFGENRKWKHVLVQPEFRLWTEETFRGHFFGLHAHYAYYNVGRLPHGPFSRNMADSRYEGWALGAGISYGYRWNFSRKWGLEATFGIGYAHLDYDKYECRNCGDKLGSDTRNYFGPTKAGITLIYSFGKKPAARQPEQARVPVIAAPVKEAEVVVIHEPQFTASFITPEAEAVKHREEAGRAYLDFAVGRSEIVPGFKDNASELDKIYRLIETVKNNPDATITGITITGYASPEGGYRSNLALSEKRAVALKNRLKALYGFPESCFNATGLGEDWAMLDTLVSRSYLEDKYAVLEIIRGGDGFDAKERRLKSLYGGAPYREMLASMYPRLRRSDYRLHYTVLPFTVEKGKEVLRTNPSTLSLNEMFLIANTYAPGSDAFNGVFETAARIFPGDDTANLNAAASALARKDAVSARRYLSRVTGRNGAYWNNAGILACMEGDTGKAAEYFARARAAGNGEAPRNAAELDRHVQSKQE